MGEENHHFGKDCPIGMVQVEFVGVSPALRRNEYGWKPSQDAFLEIWVDGQRFRIDVGDFPSARGGKRRGLHIIGPADWKVDQHSLNAIDLYLPEKDTTP